MLCEGLSKFVWFTASPAICFHLSQDPENSLTVFIKHTSTDFEAIDETHPSELSQCGVFD